jgi:polyribonucleotide nucleotidyltransferase
VETFYLSNNVFTMLDWLHTSQ